MNPTSEQEAFIQTLKEKRPCFLSARAGTGKTTTIRLGIEALIESGVPAQEISAIAFNKANQEDLAKALPLAVKVSTLHSLGFAAVRRFLPRTTIANDKVFKILSSAGIRGKNSRDTFRDTLRLVSVAKSWGLVPLQAKATSTRWHQGLVPDTPAVWASLVEHFELWDASIEKARETLQESNLRALKGGEIDFDDMVYLPVALGLKIIAPDYLIVDEAQDLSPLNLEMLKEVPSKIWYVGDPYQAIYGWRGAESRLIESLGLPVLPLTNCWRCSGAIISEARKLVGDIQTDNPTGLPVRHLRSGEVDFLQESPATILARRNAVLINLALQFRRGNKRVCIFGRDFVKALEGVLDKLKGTNSKALKESLFAWSAKMQAKFPHKTGEIQDYTKCLATVLSEVSGVQAAKKLLEELFSDTPREGEWILSTIHKAKGKEFPRVWLLDWKKKGEQSWMKVEERNLEYVAITRAKDELIRMPEPEGQIDIEASLQQGQLIDIKTGEVGSFWTPQGQDLYSPSGELLSSPTRENGLWD